MTDNDAAQPLARHPDRSIDDKFERVVAERDDLAGALVEAERERDKAEVERDKALRLAALTAEQEAANAQIIVDTRAERDALKVAAEPLLEHIDLIRAHWAVLLPRDVGETLLARGAALAALLPNTQEPCDICSGYGCPDCREGGA